MGEFMLVLLHAATNTHILHLRSRSYAEHQALGEFYQSLPDLVDALIESVQGKTGELIDYPNMYYPPESTGKEELQMLSDYVVENRHLLPQDSEIQNTVDEIQSQINSTLYKLRFLA